MANVNVSYEQMRAAGDRLTNGEQEINGQLDGLAREIRTLVDSGYVTDRSSKQFEMSYNEFTTGVKQVLEGLQGMSAYLKKAAATFEDADAQLAGALSR